MIARWLPYCGEAPSPADWLSQWNLDPVLIGALLLGMWSLRKQAAPPLAMLGILGLAILFLSPLCALSSALFSVRVGHHMILTAVLAPLLALACPALPGRPLVWTAGHALLFWFWHAPGAYAAALSSDMLFWVMQLSLLVSAIGLWSAIRRADAATGIAALLGTTVQMGLLGALLTFSTTSLYAPHAVTTVPWGLTAREDQQLAGALMWVVGSLLYLGFAVTIGWRWFGTAQRGAAS